MGATLLTAAGCLLVAGLGLARTVIRARQEAHLADLARRASSYRIPLSTAVRILGPHANEPTRGAESARSNTHTEPRQRTGARGTE